MAQSPSKNKPSSSDEKGKRKASDSDSESSDPKKPRNDFESKLDSLDAKISILDKKLKVLDKLSLLDEISMNLKINSERVEALAKENTILNKKVKYLEVENENLHIQLKKQYLVIHGIEEKSREDTRATTCQFIQNKLKLNNIDVDSAYRIGFNNSKLRPIRVRFVKLSERDLVWANRSKLEKLFFINEDPPFQTRQNH